MKVVAVVVVVVVLIVDVTVLVIDRLGVEVEEDMVEWRDVGYANG